MPCLTKPSITQWQTCHCHDQENQRTLQIYIHTYTHTPSHTQGMDWKKINKSVMYEWRGSNGGDKRWGMSIKEGSFGGSNEEGEQKRNGVLFWRDHVGRNSSCYWLLHGLAHSFSLSRHYFSLILFHLSLSHDYWSSYDSQAHAVQRSSVHQALSTQFQQKQNYCSFTDKSVYRLNLNTKVPVYKWNQAYNDDS